MFRLISMGLAAALVSALPGCGTSDLFGAYDAPESADVEGTPYPRLVDTPEAPPPGVYTATVPDPAQGYAALTELGLAAQQANERATALAAPIISDAEREALLAATKPK